MNMKNRTLYCFLGLFALGVSCTSVSSEEDMYALALKKNPALRHVLELYEGDSLKQQAALFLILYQRLLLCVLFLWKQII